VFIQSGIMHGSLDTVLCQIAPQAVSNLCWYSYHEHVVAAGRPGSFAREFNSRTLPELFLINAHKSAAALLELWLTLELG